MNAILLTIMLCKNLTRLYLEVYRALNQKRVIVKHLFTISRHELVLYMIAAIVQAAGADVAAGSLETMGFGLHFWVVSVFYSLCKGLQRWIQGKHFELSEHLVEDFSLVAK